MSKTNALFPPTPTVKQLAKIWHCDKSSICRWRRQGAPLDDETAMRSWLATRKNLPEGTRELLTQASNKVRAAAADVDIPKENTGSSSALNRLETTEARLHKLLDTALKVGDPVAVKLAREDWLAVSESLRRYDILVSREARIGQDLLPKATMEKYVASFVNVLRLSINQAINSVASNFRDPAGMASIAGPVLIDQIVNATATLAAMDTENRLPNWWIASVVAPMNSEMKDVAPTIKLRRDIILQVSETLVKCSAKERAKQLATLAAGV